jgi:hypothetical protein
MWRTLSLSAASSHAVHRAFGAGHQSQGQTRNWPAEARHSVELFVGSRRDHGYSKTGALAAIETAKRCSGPLCDRDIQRVGGSEPEVEST